MLILIVPKFIIKSFTSKPITILNIYKYKNILNYDIDLENMKYINKYIYINKFIRQPD